MLFSIIVPVYNVELYLEECVQSILRQTCGSFELILVDDGSTDRSSEICDFYRKKDARIKVIHKRNGGLVSARKAGAEIATGDYTVCVDGDDWIDENHLLSLKGVIDKYHPEIICFNHKEVTANEIVDRTIPFREGYYSKEDLQKEIYPNLIHTKIGTSFPPTIWAKVYLKDIYKPEQLSVDDRIKIGEDAACSIPCIVNANSLFLLSETLYYYRRNNESMTKNRKAFSWDVPELIERHLRRRVPSNEYEFQEQIGRRTVHALINVVKTQFYREELYFAITRDIKKQLSRPIYQEALKNSRFSHGTAIAFCCFCLRHHLYFPFLLLSKIRR